MKVIVMSWDLNVCSTKLIGLTEFLAKVADVSITLLGRNVPRIQLESSPGYLARATFPNEIGREGDALLIGFESLAASSVDVFVFGRATGNSNEDEPVWSIELPSGHSSAGYVLAVSAAIVLASHNGAPIVDPACTFTPWHTLEVQAFIDAIRGDIAGSGRNELRAAMALFRELK